MESGNIEMPKTKKWTAP